jgi:predicted GIY-YIG superfamily endonuclease
MSSTANEIKLFTFYRLSSVCTNMTYIGSTVDMAERLRNHRSKSFHNCNRCSSRRLFAAGAVDSAEIGHAECTLATAERMERGLIIDERARTDVECVNVRLPGQTAAERKAWGAAYRASHKAETAAYNAAHKAEQVVYNAAHYAAHKADRAKYARDNRARTNAQRNARRARDTAIREMLRLDPTLFE